jgi:D-alanyl-D-alanine carboxypeptidase
MRPDQDLQGALNETAVTHGPGLFGLVTEGNRVVFAGSAGVADLAQRRPIALEDRFRIGSVSKVYVATVMLQLVAESVVALDDPVEKWLPSLVPDADEITIEMVMRMRSGLPDYVEALFGEPVDLAVLARYWSPEELVRTALRVGDRRSPGSVYRYSNTDYVLLGLIIEQATGQLLEAQLWQRIFDPLQLNETSFPAVEPQLRGRHATGYVRFSSTAPYVECTTVTPSESWSSGAIVSTPREVASFLEALLTGRLLTNPWLAMMLECTESIDPHRSRGLGIVRYDFDNGVSAYGHQGGVAGFSTMALRTIPGRCVVLYQNAFDVTSPLPYDAPFMVAAAHP